LLDGSGNQRHGTSEKKTCASRPPRSFTCSASRLIPAHICRSDVVLAHAAQRGHGAILDDIDIYERLPEDSAGPLEHEGKPAPLAPVCVVGHALAAGVAGAVVGRVAAAQRVFAVAVCARELGVRDVARLPAGVTQKRFVCVCALYEWHAAAAVFARSIQSESLILLNKGVRN